MPGVRLEVVDHWIRTRQPKPKPIDAEAAQLRVSSMKVAAIERRAPDLVRSTRWLPKEDR